MDRILLSAERTGRMAVEQTFMKRLPRRLIESPSAASLRHLKLWYCMLSDDVLPPLGLPTQPAFSATTRDVVKDGEEFERASDGRGEGLVADDDEGRHPPPSSTSASRQVAFGVSLRSLHLGANSLTKVLPASAAAC